jgi:hypothetical protein
LYIVNIAICSHLTRLACAKLVGRVYTQITKTFVSAATIFRVANMLRAMSIANPGPFALAIECRVYVTLDAKTIMPAWWRDVNAGQYLLVAKLAMETFGATACEAVVV